MARANVVLPQPLSPTRPSVSRGSSAKLTSSTALTTCFEGENRPCFTGKWTLRLLTSSRFMPWRPAESQTGWVLHPSKDIAPNGQASLRAAAEYFANIPGELLDNADESGNRRAQLPAAERGRAWPS